MNFKTRPDEGFAEMRARMQRVLDEILKAKIEVRGGKRLWCGHSRPREERQRGDHAAHVRRIIRAVKPEMEEVLDVEYASGSSWIGDEKLSSAVEGPVGREESQLYRQEGGGQAWIDLTAIAAAVGRTVKDVERAAAEQKR